MAYRKLRHVTGIVLGAVLVVFAAFLFSNWLTLNFHQVLAHKVYRSRQLQYAELKSLDSRYHFKSIINLRGIHPKSSWYQAEIKFSSEKHMQHYNFSLPAHALPSQSALTNLVKTIEQAPKPVLLHCREGADRTGLASSIALVLTGGSKSQIKQQIGWRYNVLSPHTIGYQVMQNYFAWLKKKHQAYGRTSFLVWVDGKPELKPQFGWYF